MQVILESDLNSLRASRIFHSTNVDFVARRVEKPIHLVQYDNSLPIIEITLYKDSEEYSIPQKDSSNTDVYIRFGKKDGTFVYKNAMGCDESGGKVYFEIVSDMTIFDGTNSPIIELIVDGAVAGSSYMTFVIDKNPISAEQIGQHIQSQTVMTYALTVNGQVGHVETYKGTWVVDTMYFKGDTINYNDNLYLSLRNENVGHNPATDSIYWKIYGAPSEGPIPLTQEEINELWED